MFGRYQILCNSANQYGTLVIIIVYRIISNLIGSLIEVYRNSVYLLSSSNCLFFCRV